MGAEGNRRGGSVGWLLGWLVGVMVVLLPLGSVRAAEVLPVYEDAWASGWQDWSWGDLQKNLANSRPVHAGSCSIAVTFTGGWSGIQFGLNTPIDVSAFDTLRFWIHGGSAGGQKLEVNVGNSGGSVNQKLSPQAGGWTRVDVPLRDLGKPTKVSVINWFNATAGAQPTFYLDDIQFVLKGSKPLPPLAGPALRVNAGSGRHRISPLIYGMSYADESLASELHLPLRRWGGNATSRYNWQNDTSNHASDWFFENIVESDATAQLPDGSAADRFIEQNGRTSTQTLLTLPLIGWAPNDHPDACGYSVRKYGAQQKVDSWRPDCGNGVRPDGSEIAGNDANDTSIEISPAFVEEWLAHLTGRFGTASKGGVKYFNLDNEPMLWNSTHRDVHPLPVSYDEIRDRTVAYAAAVKAVDPGAKLCGPVVWGWTAYFWSALDSEPGGDWWNHPQDRLAHGDIPFLEWYLQQMQAYETQRGVRLLDYLDVHFYPQASGVFSGSAGDTKTQALRLRSTRALWDRAYGDESWINTPVYLIPRLKEWVARNYPGTRIALSEYSWGAMGQMNGALAEADVLGIFGREGLDMAALWGPPTSEQPGAFAFRMYLNYDGSGSQFGEMSVSGVSGNQDRLAIYAAQRLSDSALTLMIVNKTARALTSPVKLVGFTPDGAGKVFCYSLDDTTRIVRKADQPVARSGFKATFPAQSITLVVVPGKRS